MGGLALDEGGKQHQSAREAGHLVSLGAREGAPAPGDRVRGPKALVGPRTHHEGWGQFILETQKMTNSMNPESREVAAKHLDEWKANIRRDYERAIRILQKSEGISEDKSLECLNTAVAELLVQWRKTGPPTYVENWSAYLAHSASHVYIRPPRRDERLLIFKSPVADTKEPFALDPPSDEPSASDLAVQREVFQKVWAELINLPRSQVVALVCWAIGLSFAEIAKVLEVAEGRARVLKYKALKTLKKKCAV